tara:strand:- start:7 stop:192 length:186 start_codon:yes stop_codon:yes gene_type:complete
MGLSLPHLGHTWIGVGVIDLFIDHGLITKKYTGTVITGIKNDPNPKRMGNGSLNLFFFASK